MLHERPTAVELARAVEAFLRSEVIPATAGRLAFQSLVAANAVAIIARELELGPEQEAAHSARLEALGVADDAALAAAVRRGDLDDRAAELLAVLRQSVEAKLAVANPRYARSSWTSSCRPTSRPTSRSSTTSSSA
ncbi:MAG: hypothetical protein JO246_03365 [Frankiaceae bacterium]|nr:hypothetical protein [Frankiaceae bacterium]MBV9873042.1 hypothetical protein [Frankiaceae bacterium]